jgi:ribosomal protein L11 methyltransferase
VAAVVPQERAEIARALMLELFPEGFEERELSDGLELAAYTDAGGEERVWAAFGAASARDVTEGWEQRWRDFHRPIRVGPLWVGPPWEAPPPGVDAVVIDPGRAFGTGGHATTRLCLELLLEVEPGGLADVGCGSGVIAIAAARLGFDPVFALDLDPAALEATRRNARANRVALEARAGDALAAELPPAEVLVANVSRQFAAQLVPPASVRAAILSGYLESERPAVAGLRAVERRALDGWAADLFRREE